MYLGNFETGFVPVLRALLFPGMPPLSFCQCLLILGKIAGISNALPSGESNHRLDAKIKTNHCGDDRLRFDLVLYQNGDKVAVRTILRDRDRTGFGIFGQRSMPVDIQWLIHLGKREGLPIPCEGIGGIGSRLVMLLFLECWVLGATLKEIDKGTIQVAKGLLYGDRRNVREPGVVFFEIRKHGSQLVVIKPLSLLEIGRLAGVESPIVDKATASKRLSKDDPLPLGRREPVLVRPL